MDRQAIVFTLTCLLPPQLIFLGIFSWLTLVVFEANIWWFYNVPVLGRWKKPWTQAFSILDCFSSIKSIAEIGTMPRTWFFSFWSQCQADFNFRDTGSGQQEETVKFSHVFTKFDTCFLLILEKAKHPVLLSSRARNFPAVCKPGQQAMGTYRNKKKKSYST